MHTTSPESTDNCNDVHMHDSQGAFVCPISTPGSPTAMLFEIAGLALGMLVGLMIPGQPTQITCKCGDAHDILIQLLCVPMKVELQFHCRCAWAWVW